MPLQRSLALAGLVILLDQATKALAVAMIAQPIQVTGFFNLVLTYNTGVSFGLLSGQDSWRAWALSLVALAVAAGLVYWARKEKRGLVRLAIGLIVGGAIGNVLGRLCGPILGLLERPGVVDFLDFHLSGWHWPAFNVADSAITVGVVLLIADSLFPAAKQSK